CKGGRDPPSRPRAGSTAETSSARSAGGETRAAAVHRRDPGSSGEPQRECGRRGRARQPLTAAREPAKSSGVSLEIVPTREGYQRWAPYYDDYDNALIVLEQPIVTALLGDLAGARVADIGCGTGRHALRL